MVREIGHVAAIYRYPVKSMGGERLDTARLGWHGIDGDRRLAFRRMEDRGGFPWISRDVGAFSRAVTIFLIPAAPRANA